MHRHKNGASLVVYKWHERDTISVDDTTRLFGVPRCADIDIEPGPLLDCLISLLCYKTFDARFERIPKYEFGFYCVQISLFDANSVKDTMIITIKS